MDGYLISENKEDKESFYFEHFSKLKCILPFDFGAVFYKNLSKFKIYYKIAFEEEFNNFNPKLNQKIFGVYSLKIPLKAQDASWGYFYIARKTPFSKKEKQKTLDFCKSIITKVKDFEISKIFKNQLSILQGAIVEKNVFAKELEEKNKELIEKDKMRMSFLANVSHELRTPLNSIIGFSSALKSEMIGNLNDKQKTYATKILSSAIHLTGLINDILDMTKIEAGAVKLNLKENSPTEIINEVINIVEPLASEKNITIEKKFDFTGEIMLDYIKFRQIMYNLIGNAIKFSNLNSKIIVKTRKKENSVIISVKDFGIGISKKNHKKIFEKFVQLDNVYTKTSSSTGLGLTITSEFVKLHNGKISLKSSPGKGSTFSIELNYAF